MPPRFSHVHAALGRKFYDPVRAASFPRHTLRHRHDRAAATIGLEGLTDDEWLAHFGRFEPFDAGYPEPLALRYHGHQFQVYNPDLGDGRGFLFAQCLEAGSDRILDLGTKGSGQTPYSRSGDGRLTLKGGVREVLATAQLEALGVNTSKSFSLIETGEALQRHDEPSPTRSAVLVRLSYSHIRIGTFQRLAFEEDREALARLIEHCCRYYYPQIRATETGAQAEALFGEVIDACARTTAQWMIAGFVHGVLNTDNINITGESFDYGPYRFLPLYEPGFTAAYFDERGLYAFGRQPQAIHWNLCRLAECLLDFVDRGALADQLDRFEDAFETALHQQFCRRLAITPKTGLTDATVTMRALMSNCYRLMKSSGMVPDQFFHDWVGGLDSADRAAKSPERAAYQSADFESVRRSLDNFTATPAAAQRLASPAFDRERPITLLYDEIEAVWAAIDRDDDWAPFRRKLDDSEQLRLATAPKPEPKPA